MGTFLSPPKIRVSDGKVSLGTFDLFHAGKRQTVDESEVDFDADEAGHWFYIQVVHFKDTNEYGYHVSEGVQGTGPAAAADTAQIEFLGTVLSGNVSSDGTKIADYYQHVFPPFLLEVK